MYYIKTPTHLYVNHRYRPRMPLPEKSDSLSRKHWKKTRDKKLRRKKKPAVKIGQNCKLCVFGNPPTTTGAQIRCSNKKADVVYDTNKGYWKCHSYTQDKRLS